MNNTLETLKSAIETATNDAYNSIGGSVTSGYYDVSSDLSISGQDWTTSVNWEMSPLYPEMSDEELEKLVKRILDNEDDLVPILKNYFTKYFESLMENPDELVDKAVKETIDKKDREIDELNKRVSELSQTLDYVLERLNSLERERINDNPWNSNITWQELTTTATKYIGALASDVGTVKQIQDYNNTTSSNRPKPY